MSEQQPRVCIFSPCRKYRYTLWREWDLLNPAYLMVVGLNPSTADERNDDPTIRRCIGFAKSWGFGALCMTNLFAWRDTDPERMKAESEPVGVENDARLQACATGAGLILAAWGKHGSHMGRGRVVRELLPSLHCLKRNKDGSPMHPLYVAANTQPQPY